MTRMERRRRRRRILRIKLATTAAVLMLTTASIVALTGGAAETVPEPTPQPPALQAEPVLLVAEHDSTYQPVQMTAEPVQEPEPVEEEDENEKIEAALLEQGYLHEEIPSLRAWLWASFRPKARSRPRPRTEAATAICRSTASIPIGWKRKSALRI